LEEQFGLFLQELVSTTKQIDDCDDYGHYLFLGWGTTQAIPKVDFFKDICLKDFSCEVMGHGICWVGHRLA